MVPPESMSPLGRLAVLGCGGCSWHLQAAGGSAGGPLPNYLMKRPKTSPRRSWKVVAEHQNAPQRESVAPPPAKTGICHHVLHGLPFHLCLHTYRERVAHHSIPFLSFKTLGCQEQKTNQSSLNVKGVCWLRQQKRQIMASGMA